MKKIIFSAVLLSLLVPVTGFALSLSPDASGCIDGYKFSPITGKPCEVKIEVPGCLPGYNYSYLTGQKCPTVVMPPVDYCKYNHLIVSSNGAQVAELQTRLVFDGYLVMPYGVAKGYYGNLTAQAVARARAAGLYPCGPTWPPVPGNLPPVISGVSGPTVLRVGEQGTWTISARDPENGNLSYRVVWGDEVIYSSGSTDTSTIANPVQNAATFTHTYSRAGGFTPAFTVTDNSGQISRTSISVGVVGPIANQPPVKVLSPNGGERWLDHSVQNIVWDLARYNNPAVDINLLERHCDGLLPNQPCTAVEDRVYVLDKNITRSNNSYGWIVATDINDRQIPAGKYKVQVCVAGSTAACDYSDSYFEITPRSSGY